MDRLVTFAFILNPFLATRSNDERAYETEQPRSRALSENSVLGRCTKTSVLCGLHEKWGRR
jgi:hypothetical protein